MDLALYQPTMEKLHGDPKLHYREPEGCLKTNPLALHLRLFLLGMGGGQIGFRPFVRKDGARQLVIDDLGLRPGCGCRLLWLELDGTCRCVLHRKLLADVSELGSESIVKALSEAPPVLQD